MAVAATHFCVPKLQLPERQSLPRKAGLQVASIARVGALQVWGVFTVSQ